MEKSNFTIYITVSEPIEFYGIAERAIAFAARVCYVPVQRREALMLTLLETGQCQWVYGFDSVWIKKE